MSPTYPAESTPATPAASGRWTRFDPRGLRDRIRKQQSPEPGAYEEAPHHLLARAQREQLRGHLAETRQRE